MKKKPLKLDKNLVAMIVREFRWTQWCKIKPIEVEAVELGNGCTTYIAHINFGAVCQNLFSADLDLGECKTGVELTKRFCDAVLAKLKPYEDIENLANYFLRKDLESLMRQAFDIARKNPNMSADDAVARGEIDEYDNLDLSCALEAARDAGETLKVTAAYIAGYIKNPLED